jgi:hypothetical protein
MRGGGSSDGKPNAHLAEARSLQVRRAKARADFKIGAAHTMLV